MGQGDILKFLEEHKYLIYTSKDISDHLKIGMQPVNRALRKLLENGDIIKIKEVRQGIAYTYKIPNVEDEQ